jgi:hypothetical protein
VGVALLFGVLLAAAPAPPSSDLLTSAIDPNPSLTTYTATAKLDLTLHAGLPVHKTLHGTMYYNRPTQRIVLDDANGVLTKYKDMRMTLPSKDELFREYTLTSTSDDGSNTHFILTPKKQDARVATVTLSVDDGQKLIHDVRWAYKNGSSLQITPVFQKLSDYTLIAHEDVAARFPGYSVDGALALSGYTGFK